MRPPRPKVRTYIWDRGRDSAADGHVVWSGESRAFIPNKDLRRIADALHDRADQVEQDERRTR